MPDTKAIESEAEDAISHYLMRQGILIAKPKFDRNGSDLLAMLSVDDGAKFIRVQCKGRLLENTPRSNIKIPVAYVTPTFVTFLYIRSITNSTHLFCFKWLDIRQWEMDKMQKNYVLNFYESSFRNELKANELNEAMIEEVKAIIRHNDMKKEFTILEREIYNASQNVYYPNSQNTLYTQDTETKKITVEKTAIGYRTIIKNKVTGSEYYGAEPPCDPSECEYNEITDTCDVKDR